MIFTEKEERDGKTHFYLKIPASGAGSANGFTDAIPAWAKGSISAVAAAGFMSGYPDGSFSASANITRAEAVSSLDRMLNGAQETAPSKGEDVVIEKAGIVLENETVTGSLTIAASVGEGDVTLNNVEIKGDLIVKGGDSNSISLEDVKVGGKLTLDKDNVHLSIAGNTKISNAKVTLTGAGKINQLNVAASGVMLDSSLSVKKTVTATGVKAPTITGGSSGGGGTASTPKIAINGLKNPIGEIQVNVGDLKDETEAKKSLPSMVTLLVDNKEIKDVTAKIDDWKIKNGAFDGNTAGSYTFVGTVKIPDGYAYSNGTLTAKATITVVANNATKKQLTTDTIVQYGRIESYTEIDKEIKEALPTEVLLKCEDGSLIVGTIKNKDSWNRFGSPSSGSGEMSGYMEYPFHCDCADITLPAGYVFSQSSTITAHVYVKNRDNGKLQTALNAAWVQLDRTTNSEAEALANPDKIYLLPTNDDERNVSQGVKYVQESVQLTVTALNYTDSNG